MTRLHGLEQLEQVDWALALTSLAGVEALHAITDSLQFIATPQLSQFEIDGLTMQLVDPRIDVCVGDPDDCPCVPLL